MERVKQILKRFCCLPPLWTVCISIPAFALVLYVLIEEISGPLAYLSYVLSAYALIITLTGFPAIIQSLESWVKGHPLTKTILGIPLGKRFAEDARFRTEISLYQGFAINLIYIAIKLVSGIRYQSLWFLSLAAYYMLLAVMRLLLFYRKKSADEQSRLKTELRRYRLCGIVLLLMNQALAGVVALMVHQNRGYEYPGLLIYAMATYSFYAVILAIVNLIKFRKYGSPILSAAKAINFVAAAVSILSLETAMLAQFGGDDDPIYRKIVTGLTGGGVCVIVLGMAVFMIAKSTKNIKQLESYHYRKD